MEFCQVPPDTPSGGCSRSHPSTFCPVSSPLCQRKLLSNFEIFAHLLGMKWYLSVVLICISLVRSEVEYFHMLTGNFYILCVSSPFFGPFFYRLFFLGFLVLCSLILFCF